MTHSQFKPSIRPLGVLVLVLIGVLISTLGDYFHALTGTLYYPNPLWFAKQAWWVPLGFACAFGTMVAVYVLLIWKLPASVPHQESASRSKDWLPFAKTLSAFFMVYVISAYFSVYSMALAIIFGLTFMLRVYVSYERRFILILAVLMAVGGVVAEGVINWLEMARYSHQEIFFVPIWLIGLYCHGSFALREGMRFLVLESAD